MKILPLSNATIVDNMVSCLSTAIDHLNTEIANLDETYRKMCEEAKEGLQKQLEETKRQQEYWLSVRGGEPELKKTRKPRAKKAEVVEEAAPVVEEEEQVVDPYENETEIVQEETIPEEAAPEFDGAGFTEEDNVPEFVNTATENASADLDNLWGETPVTEESAPVPEFVEPVIQDVNTEFDMPIEW